MHRGVKRQDELLRRNGTRSACEVWVRFLGRAGGAGNVGEDRLQVEGRFYPLWPRFGKRPIWLKLKAYIHPEDAPEHPH